MEIKITYKQDSYKDSAGNVVPISPGIDQHIFIPLTVDPATQIGTAKFSLEFLQDIISLAQSRGMDIQLCIQ